MRFLALTGYQSAVLALVTTAAIIALYFLKHRRRRLVISSALLWKRVLDHRLENSLFERLRRFLSILLAVVIGLLIAMSVAQPEVEWLTGKARHTIIVMDTSPSMLARRSDGRTRWQHAADAAKKLVNQSPARDQFQILDTSGQFDSATVTDRDEVRHRIDQMHPVNSPAHFPHLDAALNTAAPLVYLITDGVSALDVPAGVTSLSEFQPAPNAGITAFDIRSVPSSVLTYEAFIEVTNFGKSPRDVEITMSGTGPQRVVRTVRIEAGKSYQESIDVTKFDGGGIRAAISSEGDAFSPDDMAYAYIPVQRRMKTLLVTSGNKFLESVLKVDSRVELSIANPAAYASSDHGNEKYDAYVFDRFAPPQAPAKPALVINPMNTWNASTIPWLPKPTGSVSKPVFNARMENHPVMEQVNLNDVAVESAVRVDAVDRIVLAAAADGTPLILASEHPQWVLLTFDLDHSDFPYHAGFPVFIDDAITWFGHDRPALRRTPGSVEVPLAGAQVRNSSGQILPTRETSADSTVFDAPDPGIYIASKGDVTQTVAVNFTNPRLSDINNVHVRDSTVSTIAPPRLRNELWVYMLCAAIFLIAVEWYTYHRRMTL